MLIELVTSMPVVILLFLSIAVLFLGCIRGYLLMLGSAELRQEMQNVMERIVLDARMATEITVVSPEVLRIAYVHPQLDKMTSTTYMLYKQPASSLRMIRKADAVGYSSPQPITGGDHTWGQISIHNFQCTEEGNLIHIELVGVNHWSDETYTLKTTVLKTRVKS
ncbi:hypothetical protein TAMA11512_19360 [Selenomonas sp. TAMA-11512]|nr:hypothetical protein TAMA11512_19360 [Selenomonas sp. TAMA-11512]